MVFMSSQDDYEATRYLRTTDAMILARSEFVHCCINRSGKTICWSAT